MVAPAGVPDLVQKAQEIPYDHPDSRFMFRKHLVATRAAWDHFGPEEILRLCLFLRAQALRCNGLDYLQVFENHADPPGPNLWFIEDGQLVTALLPSDY